MKQQSATSPVRRHASEPSGVPRRATSPITRQFILFFILFFIYLGAGVLMLNTGPVVRGLVDPWTRLNASVAAAITNAAGIKTRAEGTSVGSGSAMLSILPGCNGVEALLILA